MKTRIKKGLRDGDYVWRNNRGWWCKIDDVPPANAKTGIYLDGVVKEISPGCYIFRDEPADFNFKEWVEETKADPAPVDLKKLYKLGFMEYFVMFLLGAALALVALAVSSRM